MSDMWFRFIILAMRASPARYALPLLAGLEIGVVLIEGREWTSEWRWAIDWAGAGVFLAGPLAGGISAWQAQAARRAPGEAAQAVGSRLRIFTFNAGGVFAWAALVHGLVVLFVIADCYRSGLTGYPNPAPVLLHWSLLAGCVSIGYIAGQFGTSRLLAPVTTVGLVAFMIQASNGALPTMWVEVAGATAPLAGLQYRPEVIAGQLVLFWAPVLVALGVTRGFGRRSLRKVALGAGSIATVVTAILLTTADQGRFAVASAADLGQECFGSAPEVCVVEATSSFGPQIQTVFAGFHAAAGPEASVPDSYVQVMGTEGPSEDQRQFVVDAGVIQGGAVDPDRLIRYFVWNRNCLLADDPPPSRAVDLIADLQMVLLARMNPQQEVDDRLLGAFRALPVGVQDRWIADALAASDACAFDDIPEWLKMS